MFNVISSLTMVILYDHYFENYFYKCLATKGMLGITHAYTHMDF